MDHSNQTIVGKNATLVIDETGVAIQKSSRQVLLYGGKRNTTIPFSDIAEIRHQQASLRPGYLQISIKHGTKGVTPLTRVHRIQFDRTDAHRFRRARDLIAARMEEAELSASRPSNTNDSSIPHPPPAGRLEFRKRF